MLIDGLLSNKFLTVRASQSAVNLLSKVDQLIV
jgi:hypothetical protein